MKRQFAAAMLVMGLGATAFAQDAAKPSQPGPLPYGAKPMAEVKAEATQAQAAQAQATPAMPQSDAADALLAKAQDPAAPVATVKSADDSYAQSSWIFFFGTGLIALAGWGLTAWKKRQTSFDGNAIEHINSLALGPKHRVSVIEVDGKRLLIGLTDGHMSVLSDLGGAKSESAPEPADWREALESARSRVFSEPVVETKTPVTEHSGMFDRFEGRTPDTRPRKNRETDSVMIGLKALEERARR